MEAAEEGFGTWLAGAASSAASPTSAGAVERPRFWAGTASTAPQPKGEASGLNAVLATSLAIHRAATAAARRVAVNMVEIRFACVSLGRFAKCVHVLWTNGRADRAARLGGDTTRDPSYSHTDFEFVKTSHPAGGCCWGPSCLGRHARCTACNGAAASGSGRDARHEHAMALLHPRRDGGGQLLAGALVGRAEDQFVASVALPTRCVGVRAPTHSGREGGQRR